MGVWPRAVTPADSPGPLSGQRGVQFKNENHCEGKPYPSSRIVLGHPARGAAVALGRRRLGQDFPAGKGNADFPMALFSGSRTDSRGSDRFRLLGPAFYRACVFGPVWAGTRLPFFDIGPYDRVACVILSFVVGVWRAVPLFRDLFLEFHPIVFLYPWFVRYGKDMVLALLAEWFALGLKNRFLHGE